MLIVGALNLLVGVLQKLRLLLGHLQIVHAPGKPRFGQFTETQPLDLVDDLGRPVHAKQTVGFANHGAQPLFVHDIVDETKLFRKQIVEKNAAHAGRQNLTAIFHANPGLHGQRAALVGKNSFVKVRKKFVLQGEPVAYAGNIVTAQDHVFVRGHDRLARGGF